MIQQYDMSGCWRCSNEKKLRYVKMEGATSAIETQHQAVATPAPEEEDDVAGTIHPTDAQQYSEQHVLSVPPMESVVRSWEGNDEEGKVDGEEKHVIVTKNATKNVW